METMLRLAVILSLAVCGVFGHGRLRRPASRGSLWREKGYEHAPHDYQDMELFCGGFDNQWVRNGGKCGLCGDPYQGPRQHEAGGKFAAGIIHEEFNVFTPGQVTEVAIEITAQHGGKHEFRLCEHEDCSTNVTQSCLDEHPLEFADGSGTSWPIAIDAGTGMFRKEVIIPATVTCKCCYFQWKWVTGNRWGCDDEGNCCLGCSKEQEQFMGCADVTIA